MRIELVIFGITAFLIANVYTDGKYWKLLQTNQKYYKMAGKENDLTIYQQLNKLLNLDGFGFQETTPKLPSSVSANPPIESRIIIKGNTPEEIHQKGL